ncbi:hypothetical protein TrispH2_006402 [Trichoplax sp. H2]|uniref:G domain-containing protein n=1 Tax=Trichoplax adhaerens TaxID=10228 RepID=B3RK35_TRIAD|nr:hypothetical protein TRIADDRAFT_51609 [Trichoplax adhaerens]EDV28563.1 hypothetical protein TRIADDRAFT_51609 [Trichoplax adhaerens]RDD41533.1 hypothetical protein TrispH2_006402 [Trichoplax sp. H2]|eukprot:XP_002107765.1 hypothetical protein TRIADDRAFT_51609 [Trichoplax adhaerens]
MAKSTTFTVALIGPQGVGKSTIANYFSTHDTLGDIVGIYEIQSNRVTITNDWNEEFDVSILVVCDQADQSYKQIYDALKRRSRQVVVVINKIDWLVENGVSLIDLENHWRSVVGLHSDVVLISAKYGKNMEQLQVIITDVVRHPSAFPLPSVSRKTWWILSAPKTRRQLVFRGFFAAALFSTFFYLFKSYRR